MRNGYSKTAERLTGALALKQAPIAITFTDTLPAGMNEDAPRVAAGCRFWQEAARSAFATTAQDHSLCAIGIYTHNLQPPSVQVETDLADAIKVFADLGYVRSEDLASIPVLKSPSKYVVYSPLATATLAADVVLVFVDAAQTLILSEATQQAEGQNAPAMGRPACAVVPQVVNTGRAALSLGCCGARAYLDLFTDDVALFAIPGAKIETYLERIEALTSANRVLSRFHQLRRRDVDAGQLPTVQESLSALQADAG